MRRKQLAKRVAIAVLSAATVMTSVPATAVFAATTGVEVTAPDTNIYTDTKTTTLVGALKSAVEGSATKLASDTKLSDLALTFGDNGKYKFTAASISLDPLKIDSNTKKLAQPTVTITGAVTTKQSDGTYGDDVDVTFKADASYLTAQEKADAAKLIAEQLGKDGITYTNTSGRASAQTNLQSLISSKATVGDDASGKDYSTLTADGVTSSYSITISNWSKTNSEGSTDGSVSYTAAITVTEEKGTQGTAGYEKKEGTSSANVTGVIKADGRKSTDDSYEDQIENALEAADWTDDDFDYTAKQLSNAGYDKFVTVLQSVDANLKKDGDGATIPAIGGVTVTREKAANHGNAGRARLTFNMKRTGEGADISEDTVGYTAKLSVKHGKAALQKEISEAIQKAVADLNANPALIQPEGAAKAATVDEVKAAIKKAIDARLAETYGTSTTVASEIASYDIEIDQTGTEKDYTASTAGTEAANKGSVKFLVKVNSGKKETSDPTKDEEWEFAAKGGAGTDKTDVAVKSETYATKLEVTNLPALKQASATAISLPANTTFNTKVGKLTVTPKFTPDGANKYKIRWTNSNTTDYVLTDKTPVEGSTTAKTDKFTAENVLPELTMNSGKTSGSTTITAELIDEDGNVVSKASTLVTAITGFDDVQTPGYFAYDAIYALSGALKKDGTTSDTKYTGKTVDNRNNTYNHREDSHTTILTASPVIEGVGDNKFDPYADVTRGQFITMLYREACNEYTFGAGSTTNAKDPSKVKTTDKFSDVDSKAYYAKAVAWAVENGITDGKDATHFAPNDKITRAEAVTLIYRQRYNGGTFRSNQKFDDVKTTAYYANAVGYAAANGITRGKTDSTFAPNDNVTRGEAATFIYRSVDGGYFFTGSASKVSQ